MIAKITRGSRVGDIAAYLHGPGKANEHRYKDGSEVVRGGVVIGGNLGREGARSGAGWAQDLRAAQGMRPEIKNAIWQTSLRSAPGDRRLSDQEWADAGQGFAERMGFAEHPWVMVRHGEDHVHIVASRVSETGVVWHARQDFRAAQSAAKQIEVDYGLQAAPRQRAAAKTRTPARVEREQYRVRQAGLTRQRGVELAAAKAVLARAQANHAHPAAAGLTAGPLTKQQQDIHERIEAARRARESERGRGDQGRER